MTISFVIPAHNEEALLGRTLSRVHDAARALGVEYEVIVADDGSTDRTPEIARAGGARVVASTARQIAATRNVGARAATGDRLFFVDADTILPAATLRAAWNALESGAVGGGARVAFDGAARRRLRVAAVLWNAVSIFFRWAAGSFVFVWTHDFRAVGGFDERYFAGEEIAFSRALSRRGRMVILDEPVFTSPRKDAWIGTRESLFTLFRIVATGGRALRRRDGLDFWYGEKR